MTVLAGWLEAADIPFNIRGPYLEITMATPPGMERDLKVEITDENAGRFTAPLEKSLPAFWELTERAGYGKPEVIDRGEAPAGVRFNDDPELVAMRHREFRQVANLPAHVYQDPDYQRIISWYCGRFYRSNLRLCQCAGYDVDDIKTYAWLYLTNFYGRWRHLDKGVHDDKGYGNGKMFCSYLQQRLYSDLKPLLIRKSRNIVIDAETAELGTNVEFRAQYDDGDSDGRAVQVAVRMEPEVDIDELISDLSHDEAIEVLEGAIERGVPGAQRQLAAHRADCLECGDRILCGEDGFTGVDEGHESAHTQG